MLVLMSRSDNGGYALVALVPTAFLGALDIYYLTLEKRFRNSYNEFVKRLHEQTLDPSMLFVIAPNGSKVTHAWKSARSASTWPFYLAIAIAVVLAAVLLGGLLA